ncbi:hypothetical protein Tsubulata_007158 [Turnera subulata]|uniref:Bet v I/Major latex protein domain-containing protein n=1 Tax=Turnera subulata TaxID=218843 RepID=A0A9Q0FAU9_9ROSI|nr:hypothetical protein Tsubulata_007158 [Turnera subulata]
MKGHLSQDTPLAVPASLVWDTYSSVELLRLITELLGDVLGTAEAIEGDGGVGTIVKATFPPGTPGSGYSKEIVRVLDHEKRLKESEIIEGWMKDFGFDQYICRFEVIEKDAESSILRSSIEYELDDSKKELASFATTQPLALIAETVGKYLAQNKSSQ